MTGRAAIPGEDVSEECINEMEKEICEVSSKNSSNFTGFEGSGNYKTTLRFDFKAARHDRVGIMNRHNFKLPDFFVLVICECASNERSFCVYLLSLIARKRSLWRSEKRLVFTVDIVQFVVRNLFSFQSSRFSDEQAL